MILCSARNVDSHGQNPEGYCVIIIIIHLFQFGFTRLVHKIINYNMTN